MSTQVNWKKPLMLAAFLFVLASVAYWLEFSHKPKQEEKSEAAKKLFNVKGEQIASIQIVDGKKKYAFQCLDVATKLCKAGDNSKWEIAEPVKMKADDANLNSLVSSISNLTSSETISLKEETPEKRVRLLKEYKLDEDSRKTGLAKRVEVTEASGEITVIYLGDTHPMGDSQFVAMANGAKADQVKFDDSKVMLIPTYFKNNIEHGSTHWRDKKVMTLASHQVKALTLSGSKGVVQAERKDGAWVLQTKKNGELSGDVEAIDNVLNAAAFMTAKDFPAEKKTEARGKQILAAAKKILTLSLQTDAPAATPTATPKASEPIVLTLYQRGTAPKAGKPAPAGYKVYATVSTADPVFEVDTGLRDRMDKDVKDLRLAKLITAMERFNSKRIKFEGKPVGENFELHSVDGKWTIMPAKAEADAEKIQSFLDRVSGNRIQEFVEGSAIPAGEADGLKVSMGDEQNPTKRQFVFWKSGDKLFARDLQSKRTKEAYRIDPALKDALPWTRDFFVKKAAPETAKPAAPAAGAAHDDHSHGGDQGHAH